jgi:hypothetical protein
MSFKSNFFRVVVAACLVFSVSAIVFADTIRLKDGSIIKGKIVSFGNGKFVVAVGSRQLNFSANEVESITFDADSVPSSNVKTSNDNNSTIISVGGNSAPPTSSPKVNTEQLPPALVKPIELKVKVLADNTSNGWTNSGWVVRKGQRIRISGAGRVSLGSGRFATPGGVASLPDTGKLMAQESTGGLIAVIGDNNNEFIFVGETKEFVAQRDGALFLGVNEGNLDDNSGMFDVKIEISPES